MKPLRVASGKALLELLENGVICLTWQRRATLEAADIEEVMREINELCKGQRRPLLVEMTDTETVSRAGRAAFSEECAASRIALLGTTPVDQVLANFRRSDSYPCPTRFFTDRTEATAWLLKETSS